MFSTTTHRVKRRNLALLLATVTALQLSGCASAEMKYCTMSNQVSSSSTTMQVAAVVSPTNNFVNFDSILTASESSVKVDLGGSLEKSQLSEAIGRELSVVLADGVPQLAIKRNVKPATETPSEYDITSAIDSTFGIFNLVAKCAAGDLKKETDQLPADAEIDLLGALAIAADQFTDPAAEHKLYILSNGIQTAGDLKMQEPGQFPKSDESVRLLADGLDNIGALPDLKGAEVYWYGLGQVDGVNQSLSQKARDSLVAFWQQVIARSNGVLKVENIFGQIGTGAPHSNAISVSKIEVATCQVVRLYEENGIEFAADTSNFIDRAAAQKTASELAETFMSKGCDEITVTGYAAAGVDQSAYKAKSTAIDSTNAKLTLKRAEAFAALLKIGGFKGSITSKGGGTCGTEWAASGKADAELQRLCRRIEVSN